MKPNFALTLSFEGIGLLHRAFPGWHLVGEIDLDNSDLLGDLRALRDKAVALDPSGLRSKLVIPNDQIKYISFSAPKAVPDDVSGLVEQHLNGATPYALNELAYDWVFEDGEVQVAAVARETLREAQAFATDHGFNPVCFVASPKAGDFTGEPFFGETSLVADLCEPDEEIERDPVPVRIIGTAKLPEPAEVSEAPETDTLETSVSTAEPIPDPGHSPEKDLAPSGFAEPPAAFEGDVAEPDASEDTPSVTDPETPEDEVPLAPPTAAFTSIRASRGDAPTTAPKLDGVARQFTPLPMSADVVSDSLPGDPDDRPRAPEPVVEATQTPEPPAPRIPPAPPEFSPAPSTGHSGFSTTRTAPIVAPAEARPRPAPEEEEQRMTIFGARDGQVVGGKPKYLALILTAVLLLFLVGVAAWASIFLDDGLARFFRDDDRGIITADVPATPDLPAEDIVQAPEATAPDDGVDLAALPDQDVTTGADEILQQPPAEILSEDAARARYAATGIWQVAPDAPEVPAAEGLETFYQTSIDRDVTIQDAVALPDVTAYAPDTRPETPTSPAQAGTTYDLDARGLVRATAQGALTPDGILIFAGQPPVRPVAMPKRVIVEEVLEDPAPGADPELAGFRPSERPEDLVEQNERDTLSGRTREELASLRPKLRPQGTLAPPRETTAEVEPDTAEEPQPFIDLNAVNEAVTAAVERDTVFEDAMPQAVASSLKPNTRPRDFASTVQRTTPTEDTTVQVSAAQRVTPRIPTATSVAKQATERNALKLRKVNLIGVYGSPNARRALVRMSNGRYRKVKVGDRLDGGKVSAIGNSELRYQKGGRSLVLKMPKG